MDDGGKETTGINEEPFLCVSKSRQDSIGIYLVLSRSRGNKRENAVQFKQQRGKVCDLN